MKHHIFVTVQGGVAEVCEETMAAGREQDAFVGSLVHHRPKRSRTADTPAVWREEQRHFVAEH